MYIRPDKTQILQGDVGRNLKFSILDAFETDPILEFLLDEKDEKNVQQLINYFDGLKHNTDIASEDVYVVLPDYLFSYVESVDYTNDVNLYSLITEKTGISAEELYISMPVETLPPAPERRSVYAIRRSIVDSITAVFTRERLALTCIEPASLCFFRAYGLFNAEMPIIEMFERNASIVTYSPAGGIFIADAPMLSEHEILRSGPTANQNIQTMIAANDFAAGETYKNVNTDMPYIVLTENKNILQMPSIRFRAPSDAVTFPKFVQSNGIMHDQEINWMVALGTLLQVYDEKKGDIPKYPENPAFTNKPSFIHFFSGNLLPEEAKQAARSRQWKQVILHTCKMLSIGFGIAIFAEAALVGYFSTYHINKSLQNDYRQAKADLNEIQDEINIIKDAKKGDFQVPRAFGAIAEARPDGCGFDGLTIGNNNLNDDDPKASSEFVKVSAVAADEMVFQTFRSNLAMHDDIFSGPSLNSIQRDSSSSIKKAAISIGKSSKTN